MLHKEIMQLAKEKWGMEFVLMDPVASKQTQLLHTTYSYQEAGVKDVSFAINLPDACDTTNLEASIPDIFKYSFLSVLDNDGNVIEDADYDPESYGYVLIMLWMEGLANNMEITFDEKSQREIALTDSNGSTTFYRMVTDSSWMEIDEPGDYLVDKISRHTENRELCFKVSGEYSYIHTNHRTATIDIPFDSNHGTTMTRYFIFGNTITTVKVHCSERDFSIDTLSYTMEETGRIIIAAIEVPKEVVDIGVIEKLANRLECTDSPLLTPSEREFVLSANHLEMLPTYDGKNLFVSYGTKNYYLNLPVVGWTPVQEQALEMESLPEEIKQEIALYRNI